MKACPKCGYVDEPYRRASFNRKKGEDYTHFSNFDIMFPKEAAELKQKKLIKISPYIYRSTKWNNVITTWERWEYTSVDYEKHIQYMNHPRQKKLF